jgi:quercetin dioxygenase-like cupin family protein
MTENVTRGSFDAIASDEPYPGVVRRSLSSQRVTVTRYDFAPGAEFPRHHHRQEQVTLVEEGEVQFTLGDSVHSLSAGDWTVVAPDVEHGLRAGPEGARILAIVAPRRKDPDAYDLVDE